jgi:hypothetical protein
MKERLKGERRDEEVEKVRDLLIYYGLWFQ